MQHKDKKMAATKTSTLNLRIEPALKEALRTASIKQHRSIANMVEVMIRQHCENEGIQILEQLVLDVNAKD